MDKSIKIKSIKNDVIRIKYLGTYYSINITDELKIDENLMNTQLSDQPSNYAFLCLLRDEAIYKKNKLEAKMEKALSDAWNYFKNSDSRMNNDQANNRAISTEKYQSIKSRYLRALDKATKLSSICRAYESRERLLQTIASNMRKLS